MKWGRALVRRGRLEGTYRYQIDRFVSLGAQGWDGGDDGSGGDDSGGDGSGGDGGGQYNPLIQWMRWMRWMRWIRWMQWMYRMYRMQ